LSPWATLCRCSAAICCRVQKAIAPGTGAVQNADSNRQNRSKERVVVLGLIAKLRSDRFHMTIRQRHIRLAGMPMSKLVIRPIPTAIPYSERRARQLPRSYVIQHLLFGKHDLL